MPNDKILNAKSRKQRDIYDRIYKFVLSVLDSIELIPKSVANMVLIRQLVRSVTSIGANALEADGSETKKEFIHRFTISKKEAKETYYWLLIISDYNPNLKRRFEVLLRENNELILTISKIIINAKKSS